MIIGIGVDIVDAERIRKINQKFGDKFLERVFTGNEIKYCMQKADSTMHLAGRFAVKEAMFKALGTGWRFGITWRDIEVCNNSIGAPTVKLSGKTLEYAQQSSADNIYASISHDGSYAVATVVLEA